MKKFADDIILDSYKLICKLKMKQKKKEKTKKERRKKKGNRKTEVHETLCILPWSFSWNLGFCFVRDSLTCFRYEYKRGFRNKSKKPRFARIVVYNSF